MNPMNNFHLHFHQNIPLNTWQRGVIAAGSTLLALLNPTRGDLVATLSETTGFAPLAKMVQRMKETEEGSQLLKEKPIITSESINLEKLSQLPKDTFGYQYYAYLKMHQISPDTRMPIRFVPDADQAYALLRYRQTHDFFHALTDLDVSVEGELVLKYLEWTQTELPMCALSSTLGPLRLNAKERAEFYKTRVPWAVKAAREAAYLPGVYYEKHFEKPMDELRKELNIGVCPFPKA